MRSTATLGRAEQLLIEAMAEIRTRVSEPSSGGRDPAPELRAARPSKSFAAPGSGTRAKRREPYLRLSLRAVRAASSSIRTGFSPFSTWSRTTTSMMIEEGLRSMGLARRESTLASRDALPRHVSAPADRSAASTDSDRERIRAVPENAGRGVRARRAPARGETPAGAFPVAPRRRAPKAARAAPWDGGCNPLGIDAGDCASRASGEVAEWPKAHAC